jgi:hypothetical protein
MSIGWINALISPVLSWLTYVYSPTTLIRECTTDNLRDSPIQVMAACWIAPITLMLVTNALVLHFYGIDLKSDPYLAVFYLVIPACAFVTEAFILYAVLKKIGAKITLSLAFICFSMMVIYAPINNWVQTANAIQGDELLALLKSQNLSLSESFLYLLQHAAEINKKISSEWFSGRIYYYAQMISVVIYLFSATLVAECVSQMLNLERPKAYVATAFASAINLIPGIFLALVQACVTFAFIVPHSS